MPGSTKAWVGHASRHRTHEPHRSAIGASAGRSRSVRISASSRKEPRAGSIRQPFFPIHPTPADALRAGRCCVRVDADAPREAASRSFGDGLRDALGAEAKAAVVVVAIRVPRDAGAVGGDGRIRAVGKGETHDGTGAREQIGRGGAYAHRPLEIAHAGVPAFRDPSLEPVEVRRRFRARDLRAPLPRGIRVRRAPGPAARVPRARPLRERVLPPESSNPAC